VAKDQVAKDQVANLMRFATRNRHVYMLLCREMGGELLVLTCVVAFW
jgi:hypothetical protein